MPGLYNFMHVVRGCRHVVPESGGFDPQEIFDLAPILGSVHFFAAPTMVKRLVDVARQTEANGEGIRSVVYAGGPMYFAGHPRGCRSTGRPLHTGLRARRMPDVHHGAAAQRSVRPLPSSMARTSGICWSGAECLRSRSPR